MRHLKLLRAVLGSAGLLGCIGLLAGQARADIVRFVPAAPLAPAIVVTAKGPPVAPSVFGTVALPVRADRYSAGWRRAALDASYLPSMQRLIAPARGLARAQQLAFVQAAVTRNIRWISDATEWGQHDYWASAAETLQHGAGDMEDRAIVKMQALKSLGFAPRDLYLTMGRDKVGGLITVLLVRLGNRFYIIDDLGGAPVAADMRQGFEPMVTLGHNASWIHGRPVAASRLAIAASAASRTSR
jgi:predicted transglutaminase-like cysteine proteinase